MSSMQPPTASVRPRFDLEDRTLRFSDNVRSFIRKLKKTLVNVDDCKQLLRSSGSIGANYREANNSLGSKDFLMHIRICRKESKESVYWLQLIETQQALQSERQKLLQEAKELELIFGAILRNSTKK